jgi:hypothetical protein
VHIPAKRFNPGSRRQSGVGSDPDFSQFPNDFVHIDRLWLSGPGEFIPEPLDESGPDQGEFDARISAQRRISLYLAQRNFVLGPVI